MANKRVLITDSNHIIQNEHQRRDSVSSGLELSRVHNRDPMQKPSAKLFDGKNVLSTKRNHDDSNQNKVADDSFSQFDFQKEKDVSYSQLWN